MIGVAIPRLFDMCATSITYKLWTNQDIYENWREDYQWQLLESKVTSDLKCLPLPEKMKSRILSIVKPAGRHFFGFLNIWFTKVVTAEKWLTKGSLSAALTLYAVGIINQRETAKKLLKTKPLDPVIAFRLACINFLEKEVLMLWPRVSQYFLNKIVLEHYKVQFPSDNDVFMYGNTAVYGHVQEPNEVLFWIGYCFSRESGAEFRRLPHYAEPNDDWYIKASDVASVCGDITFFEYLMSCGRDFSFSHQYPQYPIEMCLKSNNYLISFFYHFSLLQAGIKKCYFRKCPQKIMCYFLQWPLSSLVLEYPQEICDLFIELDLLDWLFLTIMEILYGVDLLRNGLGWVKRRNSQKIQVSNVYSVDHVKHIWTTLWQICPDERKSRMINSFAFTDKLQDFLEKASFRMNFVVSILKHDLQSLFRLNGDAFLRFMEVENLADALEKVISEYMPERNLDWQKLGFELSQTLRFGNRFLDDYSEHLLDLESRRLRQFPSIDKKVVRLQMKFDVSRPMTAVGQEFINYIQEFLFFSNNMNKSHFYS